MGAPNQPAILIVDEEGVVATKLKRKLLRMGYDAFAIAATAEEAVLRANERRPDVVLLDIRINGPVDGVGTAQLLRERFHVPIVFLIASADAALIERAKTAEPKGYLLKPVQAAWLRSVLEIALHQDQVEQARARAAEFETRCLAWQEGNRLKDRFLSHMSHELRTPLNGLLGFAELMQEGVAGPLSERGTEFLHHVLTSGRHFLQVINDVLDLARLEAGSLDCHPAPVDLRMLIEEVLQTLRPTLLSKSQHVAVHIDPACTQVINDPAMLKQLLYQYLSNAIKFNPRAGTVTLRASMQESGTFRLEVTDIGIGIEPQDVDRLFTPFEQLDEGVRKRFEGAGVGLALAKRIAELQGGRVGVESSPNKGSTFFAVLPRVVELQPVLENRSR